MSDRPSITTGPDLPGSPSTAGGGVHAVLPAKDATMGGPAEGMPGFLASAARTGRPLLRGRRTLQVRR